MPKKQPVEIVLRYKPQPGDDERRDRYIDAILELAPPITAEQCWRVYSLLLHGRPATPPATHATRT